MSPIKESNMEGLRENLAEDIFSRALTILVGQGVIDQKDVESKDFRNKFMPLAADGSTRHFYRLATGIEEDFIIAAPKATTANELSEASSAWHIGTHLYHHGIPLPQLYGWDGEIGLLIFEDLGDFRLHDILAEITGSDLHQQQKREQLTPMYLQVLDELLRMQINGVEGFDASWCWDTQKYDAAVMREKESDYFLSAFWKGLLAQEENEGVLDEFDEIARMASRAESSYFLHRDFQSRNIMVKDGRVRFIDFQGGRLGPLGYDLASLLIDPYAQLNEETQHELLSHYINGLSRLMDVDRKAFIQEFKYLALQRNLQILGAYSFLSTVRGKPFFKAYLRPALEMLANRLEDSLFAEYHQLKKMVRQAGKLLRD